MLISTRGRYALRVMIDLAENEDGEYIPMKTIAQRQQISLKYLEQILPRLTKNHLIEGIQGKNGGYRLCRRPEEYKVEEILRLAEGSLAPVACLESDTAPCKQKNHCRTISMWRDFYDVINRYFNGITIADLMQL